MDILLVLVFELAEGMAKLPEEALERDIDLCHILWLISPLLVCRLQRLHVDIEEVKKLC